MRHLLMLRRGSIDDDMLDEDSMNNLARIAKFMDNLSYHNRIILSSPEPVASASAKYLADNYGIPYKLHNGVAISERNMTEARAPTDCDLQSLMVMIEKKGDFPILVSNLHVVRDFSDFVVQNKIEYRGKLEWEGSLESGKGFYFNFTDNFYRLLPEHKTKE